MACLDKSIARARNAAATEDGMEPGRRPGAAYQKEKHKNAYYRFRNTAISLKSARLSFIKRKQILMYFYTRPPSFVLPATAVADAAVDAARRRRRRQTTQRGVEAKSNYFYSGEMSAAKSLILINGPDSDQLAPSAHRPRHSAGITHNSNGSK